MNSLCKNVTRGYFSDINGISKELMKIIRSMLQVTPGSRPSAKELLETTSIDKRNSCNSIKKNYNLLKTIFFDNRVVSLRNKLPKSQYCRQLSADDIKENLPSIDESIESTNKSHVKDQKQVALPRIPLTKALPPKVPKAVNLQNCNVNNPQNNDSNSPCIVPKLSSPTIITHSPLVNHQIRRVGSLILEQKRYRSPQIQIYERVASLGNLDKPCTPKPVWWG